MPDPDRLDSWKEIAAYLKRDVRTLRRWEKEHGLPVHRHLHNRLGSVYAFRSELDAWWAQDERRVDDHPAQAAPEVTQGDEIATPPRSPRRYWAGVAALVCLAVAGGVWWGVRGRAAVASTTLTQLTLNSAEVPVTAAAISPDGKFLAYADTVGVLLETAATAETRRIPLPGVGEPRDLGWLPDSTSLIVATASAIWRTSIFGDPPRRLTDGGGLIAVSRDGSMIAVTDPARQHIRAITAAGEAVGDIAPAEPRTRFSRPAWSRDGTRIAFIKTVSAPGQVESSIETRRVDGTAPTTIFAGPVHSVTWAPDGRVLFARPFPPPRARYSSLWQVMVDGTSGQPRGVPTRLTDAPDFTYQGPSLTADGRTLAFVVTRLHIDAYEAAFDPVRHTLAAPTLAVLTHADNLPTSWASGSDALLFVSNRNGRDAVYRQVPGNPDAEALLVRSNGSVQQAALTHDGAWIYYVAVSPDAVMRAPAAGGAAQTLMPLTVSPFNSSLACAQEADRCVVGELQADRLTLTPLSATTGQRGDSRAIPAPPSASSWDLSPDGHRVVAVRPEGGTGRIVVVDLESGAVWEREHPAFANAETVAWTRDARGWILTKAAGNRGGEVLYVDPVAEPVTLWKSMAQRLWRPVVAPDGRRIAFSSSLSDSTVWVLRGF